MEETIDIQIGPTGMVTFCFDIPIERSKAKLEFEINLKKLKKNNTLVYLSQRHCVFLAFIFKKL